MKKLIGGGLAALALGLSSVALAPTASAYNSDTVAQFVDTVNIESARYNLGHVAVYVDVLESPDIMAQTDGQGITLNANWADLTPDEFNYYTNQDIASGFMPGGCGGIQAVAIHEMGHVIDRLGGKVARRTVSANASQIDSSDLHGYAFDEGSLNPGEAVAVSFQATECGTATATERQIYDLMFS